MKRAVQVSSELVQIETIRSLTNVFESIASMRIAKIKDQVMASNKFFQELWALYSKLRIETNTPALAALAAQHTIKKTVFVLVTSEGGLSGDIDQQIIESMKSSYHPDQVDLVVLGAHGVSLLQQANFRIKKYFSLPTTDTAVDVTPVISQIAAYQRAEIFYQQFISLAQQRVQRIPLLSAVRSLGEAQPSSQSVITPAEFYFEPSIDEVVVYLESAMMGIALTQTIFEARLSQLAARFNAMSEAQNRAQDLATDLKGRLFAAKRMMADERTREVVIAMESI